MRSKVTYLVLGGVHPECIERAELSAVVRGGGASIESFCGLPVQSALGAVMVQHANGMEMVTHPKGEFIEEHVQKLKDSLETLHKRIQDQRERQRVMKLQRTEQFE
jgi:hypothetical protein